MTPLHLQIALHYWCFDYDYENGEGLHYHSMATQQYLGELVSAGLLECRALSQVKPLYKANREALKVYIEALCSVPLPVEKKIWAIPK